jgi:hypothetical protein
MEHGISALQKTHTVLGTRNNGVVMFSRMSRTITLMPTHIVVLYSSWQGEGKSSMTDDEEIPPTTMPTL